MAPMQKISQPNSSAAGSRYSACKPSMVLSEHFPVGLRVLVVDDDTTCLKILEQMLRRCLYTVTLCSQATVALNLLRERKGSFDMVLSDVHMPDMDGYKLLEHVGLEMDLPVIMMSADGRTSAVMRGIRHGACDYLIKPIREEELKNIWQHVVRKKWNETKELGHSGSLDVNEWQTHGNDASAFASSVNEGTEGAIRVQRKKRDSKEDDDSEIENDDPSTSKKPRVVWSVELHQQFVNAVNQLGLDKAVPKRILELMNVPGLTRENVASHLQKFRLYLKRLCGVALQGGICNSFYGSFDPNIKFDCMGRLDIQALAASGQIPSQTLAALHAELLDPSTYDLSLRTQPTHPQNYSQRQKHVSEQERAQLLVKNGPYASRTFSLPLIPTNNVSSGYGAWTSSIVEAAASGENYIGGLKAKNSNMYGDVSRQQNQSQPMLTESNRSIIVQPSCLVVPSQSSSNTDLGHDSRSPNQVSIFYRSSFIDYGTFSQLSRGSSPGAGLNSALDVKRNGIIGGYSVGEVVSPSTSSSSINADAVRPDQLLDQGSYKNIGKISSFPSRFGVEVEPSLDTLSDRKINNVSNDCVKPEPDLDWDNARVGVPMLQHFE